MSHVSSDALKSPPRLNEIGRGRSFHWRVILVLAVLAGLALLFWLNPAQYAIYPRCAFYSMTGWQCPGCGGLRATHQMLHGNWGEAWALNPIAVLLVPGAVWIGIGCALSALGRRGLPMPRFTGRMALVCLTGLALFGVLRNLL